MTYKYINDLSAISSTNDKIAYLKANKDHMFDQVLKYALDPKFNYGIKKIPEYTTHRIPGCARNMHDAFELLQLLNDRVYTGNTAKSKLTELLSELSADDADVLTRIIKRDLKCGVNTGTVRKAYGKDFIDKMPVMLATAMSEKAFTRINFPAIAQIKYDGARCLAHKKSGKVSLYTRNGKKYYNLPDLVTNLESFMDEDMWLDGELIFGGDRKTSNGIANKSIKETITDAESTCAVFHVWDYYSTSDSVTKYVDRIDTLSSKNAFFNRHVEIAIGLVVDSMEEAQSYYEDKLGEGEEGIILKNLNGVWEDKRSPNLVKFKDVQDADLVCVGWVEGSGKYTGMLGALQLESGDGMVKVSVGTGFNDEQRGSIKADDVVGKIIEVKYNEIIGKKNNDIRSLFLPVFSSIRFDKDTADIL